MQPPVIPKLVHGLNLKNWHACHNICLDGSLGTPNFYGQFDPGLVETHRHIDSIPLDELRNEGPQGNMLAPRVAKYILYGAAWDRGLELVDGYDRPITASAGKKSNVIDMKNTEIAFEAGRREHNPSAASRLSCIWLAEHSHEGEASIRHMLGSGVHIYIFPIRITHCLALTRADAAWFDEYCHSPKPDYIKNYWLGLQSSNGGRWEYLLDGRMVVERPSDIAYIRENGARL